MRRTFHFGPESPGAVLAMYDGVLRRLTGQDRGTVVAGSFVVLDLDAGEAVGQLGVTNIATLRESADIGYGMNASVHGRGIGTRAVALLVLLVQRLRQQPGVREVTADTAVANVTSQRVLAKKGFIETGRRVEEEDGELSCWRLDLDRDLTSGWGRDR